MAYLLDTGVLLRLVNKDDAQHPTVKLAVEQLTSRRVRLFTTNQNIAEYWNVATRSIADNGLNLPAEKVASATSTSIEPYCTVLREHSQHFTELKRILTSYKVVGKQVHDARLVAAMVTWKLRFILTLNEKHFKRFEAEGITIQTPQSLVGSSDN